MDKKQNKDGVVYTCMTGDYDTLKKQKYVNPNWDYICFTNNEQLLKQKKSGIWHIKPLHYTQNDNTRIARYHKIHPHEILSEYNESIWIDTSVSILTSYIFEKIKEQNQDILIPLYPPPRNCIYEEALGVIQLKKDNEDTVRKQMELIKSQNMPEHYGLNMTTLMYRKHNKANIINLMNQWWEFIEKGSKRDQLSLSYVLFRNNIKIDDVSIPTLFGDKKNFQITDHKYISGSRIENKEDRIIYHIGRFQITIFKGLKFFLPRFRYNYDKRM